MYENVRHRRIVFCNEAPGELPSTWPENKRSLEQIFKWLAKSFFLSNPFVRPGLQSCGKDCITITDEQLQEHQEKWSEDKRKAPWVFRNKDGYLCITIRSPNRAKEPKPVPLHRLVCWWCFGPPIGDLKVACHFACENKGCLCPRHLR